jgi:hypothetical protein
MEKNYFDKNIYLYIIGTGNNLFNNLNNTLVLSDLSSNYKSRYTKYYKNARIEYKNIRIRVRNKTNEVAANLRTPNKINGNKNILNRESIISTNSCDNNSWCNIKG